VTDSENLPNDRALRIASELHKILELEFQALRVQDLNEFELLQPAKLTLLADITAVAPPADVLQQDSVWQEFRELMLACRDLHRRNEVLMERKLDAIRGALESLKVQDPTSSIEVYDRLGHIARFSRGKGYNDA